MANDLLNELNRNLANAEETGNVEWAAALKKRIAQLDKPAPVATKTVTSTVKETVEYVTPKAPAEKSAGKKK